MAYHTVLTLSAAGHAPHTTHIQQALDACRDAGGGEVALSAGEWHIASLRIYSHTTLRLLPGTHVMASSNWQDYTDFHVPSTLGYLHSEHVVRIWNLPLHYVNAPITAIEAENVAIIGEEGSSFDGADCYDPNGEEHFRGPMGMVFCKCKNVHLAGYTYRRAANWCHQLDSCEHVTMQNVTVLGGHDGVNIHHCKNVLIERCDFQTGDDCIAGYNAQNVTVRHCRLNTSCNAFRIGAKTLRVEDCHFYGPGNYPHRVSGRHNTLYAFEYYAMEHDVCHRDSGDWLIRDCTFHNLDAMLHYNFGREWTHNARPLRDITFRNIQVTGLLKPSAISTLPDAPIHTTIENASLSWRNGRPTPISLPGEGVHYTIHHLKEEDKQ